VTVAGQTAYRKWEYFRDELAVNNSPAALWSNIVVTATGQTSVSGNVFVAKAPETFTYDLDGNLTGDGRWTYSWDAENRLTNMVSLSSAPTGSKFNLAFAYDAQGRRIQKIVSTNNGSAYYPQSTNRFVYDGWNLVAVLNPASALVSSFVWGTDLSGSAQGAGGVGGLLEAVNYGVSTNFVAYDGNGNVAALIRASDGTNTATYEYGPFGEVIRATGASAKANPFRFSTKYQDDEADLLYYGYRFYNQSQGRWLSRDPEEENGGENLYAFVYNNALQLFDMLGLEWRVTRYTEWTRAFAQCDAGDTVRGLAQKIHLDVNEYQKWLKSATGHVGLPTSPDDPLPSCSLFTIPNKVYVNRVEWRPLWILINANKECWALATEGFNVKYQHDLDNDTVLNQFSDPDIYGFINVAHGESEPYAHGEIETTDVRGFGPVRVQGVLHHKLGGFKLIQCWGDERDWPVILAPGAYYWAGHGKIRLGPKPGF